MVPLGRFTGHAISGRGGIIFHGLGEGICCPLALRDGHVERGVGVYGLRLGVQGSRLRVQGSECGIEGWIRPQGFGFGMKGLGFGVQG